MSLRAQAACSGSPPAVAGAKQGDPEFCGVRPGDRKGAAAPLRRGTAYARPPTPAAQPARHLAPKEKRIKGESVVLVLRSVTVRRGVRKGAARLLRRDTAYAATISSSVASVSLRT